MGVKNEITQVREGKKVKRKDKESEKVGQQENLFSADPLMLTNITAVIYQSAAAPETFKHLHHNNCAQSCWSIQHNLLCTCAYMQLIQN